MGDDHNPQIAAGPEIDCADNQRRRNQRLGDRQQHPQPGQQADVRSAPQNLEAERSVLGALLLHPDAVADITFLKGEDFFLRRHQLIFESIVGSYNDRQITDPIAVGEQLSRQGQLEEIGGHDQLLDLAEGVVTAAGVVPVMFWKTSMLGLMYLAPCA